MILLNLTNGNSKWVRREKNLNAQSDVAFEVALPLDPLAIFCFVMNNVGSLPFTPR